MAKPLFSVGPGGALESGLAASRHKESVEFWHDGENVCFRNLGVEKAIGAEAFAAIGSPVIRLAQAWVGNKRRLYAQDDQFRVWGWNEPGPFYFIGTLAGAADLSPWGSWLVTAQAGLKVWKNGGELTAIAGAPAASLLGKNSEHLLAATEDTLFWPDVRNIEDWEKKAGKTGSALYFRNLEGPITAVRNLAQGLALYTPDALRLVSYKGAGFWFGKRDVPLDGIGAVGPNSVIEAGFKNYGITRNGIFVTDGSQFQYIDTPAFHGYLNAQLDWNRASEVFGFHNESYGEVVWFFPDLTGTWLGLGYKYTNGGFTKYRLPVRAALDRNVFPYPIFGTETGVAYGKGQVARPCFVRTKPLDAGDSTTAKFWDHLRFIGKWTDGFAIRVGVHDEVNEEPEWLEEPGQYLVQPEEVETNFYIYREHNFLTIELSTDEAGTFEISQILAVGEMAGRVF